jgi:Family of unknown function (DUF5681)
MESNEETTSPQQGGYKKIQPRWKQGESGNPMGAMPKFSTIQKTLRKGLQNRIKEGNNSMDVIINNLLDGALQGDIAACVKVVELIYLNPTRA